ncbi:hypothetical protein ACRB68_13200 [Actinomadura sp. RB68]|uniref:histidine kinase n=2 Tax=Actinomadura macrotermitis TaxID=2585200 RepID=A0A7K0BQ11_9ACTN|nr:hypothetical protein [Actinomadura macrotermitis]
MPRSLPPVVRTALRWCGALAFPLLLAALAQLVKGDRDGWGLLMVLLLMLLPVGLLLRRPLPALALMLACWAGGAVTVTSWGVGYVMILMDDLAVALIAATRPRRTSAAAAALTAAVQLVAAFAYISGPAGLSRTVVIIVLGVLVAWTAGDSARERREHAGQLRDRAAAQAVTEERLRIARELHDMVAHSIGIIAIQAGVGSRVIETQPAEARNALSAIEATSRETLAGLRRMLGALRQAGPVPLGSAPGLADVARLAEATAGAGVRVEVRWRGERRPLPAEIEQSAFRIVQEAVTNVVRHAGVPECRVTIEQRAGELAVEVLDEGSGGGPGGAGYGIVGMRERVGLLHGDFAAGPRPGGGFRVAARLPVPR